MNKLITKIVGAALGLTMAVGVGFAVAEGIKGATPVYATYGDGDESVDFTAQGYTNQQAIGTYTGTDFSVSWDKGTNSNAPKYFTSGTAVRVYGGGTMTVSSTTKTISKIEITGYSGNTFSTDVGDFDSGTWTGSSASVVFTSSGTSGNTRVQKLDVWFVSSDIIVTITGSSTVSYGTPVTYSCDSGVSATWTLENVSPAGCATISGNTVTAVTKGTATLVCTPSTTGYKKNTLALTIDAPAVHNALAAGEYYIAVVPSYEADNGLLVPAAASSNPASGATSFVDSSNAWTIEENNNENNAYNIKKGNLYLEAINDAQGIKVIDYSSGTYDAATKYWTISKEGTDSSGNPQYHLHFNDGGSRFLSYWNSQFRYYTSGDNTYMNLIPVSRTLSALTVSGTLSKSSYDQNDNFDSTGAVVTGTYTNGYGDSENVYFDETENASLQWTPSKLSTTGSVNVYAKIGELTSTNYFTVTVTAVAVPVTGVSLDINSKTFDYEDIGTTQQLTETVEPSNASNKNVIWTSSDTDVATVSSTGLVTAVGVGTATITVETVNGGFKATCSVTINGFAGEYHKVTDTSKLYAGMKFVLVYETGSKVAGAIADSKVFFTSQDATVDGGEASSSSETVFTLGGTVNNWTLTTSQGLLYATAAKSLVFDSEAEGADSTWTITISGGNVSITSNTSGYGTIKYNTSSPRFLNYASGQTAIQLYAADHEDNVYEFISDYMKMGDTSRAGNGTGVCSSGGDYLAAKAALNDLASEERSDFQNDANGKYTAALARYNAWALYCKDGAPFDGNDTIETKLNSANIIGLINSENGSVSAIIVIVSLVSITAIGGYFFIRRRKQQQ